METFPQLALNVYLYAGCTVPDNIILLFSALWSFVRGCHTVVEVEMEQFKHKKKSRLYRLLFGMTFLMTACLVSSRILALVYSGYYSHYAAASLSLRFLSVLIIPCCRCSECCVGCCEFDSYLFLVVSFFTYIDVEQKKVNSRWKYGFYALFLLENVLMLYPYATLITIPPPSFDATVEALPFNVTGQELPSSYEIIQVPSLVNLVIANEAFEETSKLTNPSYHCYLWSDTSTIKAIKDADGGYVRLTNGSNGGYVRLTNDRWAKLPNYELSLFKKSFTFRCIIYCLHENIYETVIPLHATLNSVGIFLWIVLHIFRREDRDP